MTVLIDLGEVRELPPEPEPPRRRRPLSRRTALILAGLLLVVTMGGAAVPRRGLTGLFAVPIEVSSAHLLDGDTLYVSHDARIDAYRLPDGTRRWTTPAPRPVGLFLPVPAAGVVLAGYATGDPTGMLALDARTGRVLWRDDRSRLLGALSSPSRALLVRLDDLRAVDLPTGRTVWERPRALGMGLTVSGRDPTLAVPARLAFDSGGGVTEVVDAGTGTVVARSRLESHWPLAPPGQAAGSGPLSGYLLAARSVVGGRLFVARSQGGSTMIDAYDLVTLAHQWRTQVSRPAFFVTACGPVLCVAGYGPTTGLDPRSGAVLWDSGKWRDVRGLPGGRLLVSGSDSGEPTSVMDATGLRPLLRLPGWRPLLGSARRSWLVGRDTGGLRTWFAVLDPAGPAIHPFGWVSGVQTGQCEYGDAYLACPTVGNQLQVWRYRPATAG